jgi:HTH-type transcriptional regulator/antitoxin HigA
MIKRNWIEPSENIEVLEQRILKFFEAKNLNETPAFPHAARKKGGITQLQLAWLFRAKHLARAVSAKTFSDSSFNEALEKLKTVRMNVEELRHVPRILAESGIRFLILEHLPHTAIDGVTFWLNSKSPVIALSLRYDRIDWFWYTLSHELGHVRSKDGLERELMLDVNIVGDQAESFEGKDEGEKKADKFASEFLVNPSELDDFILRVRPLYGKLKILGFSRRVGVHPGIVVGQLQYRGEVNWSYYRAMLERVRNVVIQSALTDGWGHKISTVM